jgi:hypothetical protein
MGVSSAICVEHWSRYPAFHFCLLFPIDRSIDYYNADGDVEADCEASLCLCLETLPWGWVDALV